MASKKGALGLLEYVQIWAQSGGYALGDLRQQSDDAIFAAASPPEGENIYPLFRENIVSVDAPQVGRAISTFNGAGFLGAMVGGVQNFGAFGLIFPELDAELIRVATGALTDATTMSAWRMFGYNNVRHDLPQVGMSLHYKFQSTETGTDGEFLWANLIYPKGNLAPGYPAGNNAGGANPMSSPWQFIPTVTGKHPNGATFANMGFTKAEGYWIITSKPLALSVFVSDATETTVQLPFLPVYSAATATNNWATRSGATTAATSWSTSTGEVEMAAAGTAGNLNHFWYETEFVAA